MSTKKKDCRFYKEEHDMGATIPYCERLGYDNCFDFDCGQCSEYRYNSNYLKCDYDEDMGKTIWVEED